MTEPTIEEQVTDFMAVWNLVPLTADAKQAILNCLRELAAIRSRPLPVESPYMPGQFGLSRDEWHNKAWQLFRAKTFDDTQLNKVNMHTVRAVFDATYDALAPAAESLQSALKVAQQELNKNPCCCVPDSDNGEIAHLCKWHQDMLGGALKIQRMADTLTVGNVLKLPDEAKRRFIAHGIQESTARKKADERNKRLVELLNNPSEAMITAGMARWGESGTYVEIFKAMSAELLLEVDRHGDKTFEQVLGDNYSGII